MSNKKNSALIAYKHRTGKVVRLAEGIYSDDVLTPVRAQICRDIEQILTLLGVEGALSWQSALAVQPSHDVIYLQGASAKRLTLSDGMIVDVTPSKVDNVHRLPIATGGKIVKPSLYRAIIENLLPGKVVQKKSDREGALHALRQHIDTILTGNPDGLKADLDVFGAVSSAIGVSELPREVAMAYDAAFARLAQSSVSHVAVDGARLALFSMAAERLQTSMSVVSVPDSRLASQREPMGFVESYFSNYIEGTEFEIEEAEKIVFQSGYGDAHPRSKDGHDIVALYKIILSPQVAILGSEVGIKTVRAWHRALMKHRFDTAGEFKENFNRAGNTKFVAPELVSETLRRGFDMAKDLSPGLPRAAFLKLVFTEVHPFDDGNGRISRLLLNNELASNGMDRLIVPTVFREDYMLAMKAFSQQSNIHPFERMMSKLVVINRDIPRDASRAELVASLHEKSAFCLPSESMWGVKPPMNAGDVAASELPAIRM
ncbi:Fic family protein [Devosia sp.]|uniref:Fic family protein n=1 Tax=Devosia sp. TaxID=1871048 RepID=UPI00273628C1|nr:Fic family protein [Devosia sp.]MDP2782256.1 Fic family protein [Devosia sp.]